MCNMFPSTLENQYNVMIIDKNNTIRGFTVIVVVVVVVVEVV